MAALTIDPAIKHVNFVVPAKGEGMPSPQRLTGVRHWIPAFAGITNLKNLNIFSCRLNNSLISEFIHDGTVGPGIKFSMLSRR